MIKPTIGRVVWFWPHDAAFGGQPHVAFIAFVHSDTMVNLAIFDNFGVPYHATSVHLRQERDGAAPDESFCEWMPYQIGQAKEAQRVL
jgi:hypothetical protein